MKNSFIKYILQNHFLTAILFIMAGWFLLEIKDILAAIFISYIIMAALLPFVAFLRKRKIPHVLAVIIAYFTTLLFVVVLIFPLIPFFVAQIQALFEVFPRYLNQTANLLGININISQINTFISSEFASIGKSAIGVTSKVFSGVFSVLTILIVSFYLLLDHDNLVKGISNLFPVNLKEKVLLMFNKIEGKLGAWVRGQVMLSAFIGIVSYISLTLLGLDFALPLALLAGILEIVPIIGPILSSLPAIIVAFVVSPTLAITVAVFYIILQILENNILVPKIMQRAVGLNPVIIILGIMVGTRFMGIIGALLSIPFLSMLIIIFQSLKEEK